MRASSRKISRKLALVATILCVVATASAAHADHVVSLSSANQPFGRPDKGLALSAGLERHVVHVGDPIPVTFAIKDDGPPIGIFRRGFLGEYDLHGTGPDGSTIKPTDEKPLFSGSIRSGWGIAPGEVYEHTTANIASFYDFSKPGHYKFYFVSAVAREFHLSEPYAVLTSNTVNLTVQ